MLRALPAVMASALLSGCGSQAGLPLHDDPDQFVLYSIDGPSHYRTDGQLTPELAKGELLHGYPVLGKVEITDPAQRRAALNALRQSVGDKSAQAACFIPRHAIRSVKGGETVEMVICFECRNYQSYRQDKQLSKSTLGISASAQPLFDKLLSDAGIPLAAKDWTP